MEGIKYTALLGITSSTEYAPLQVGFTGTLHTRSERTFAYEALWKWTLMP